MRVIPTPGGRLLIAFGAGQLSRSILWCTADMLIAYHLVVRLGLAAPAAGMIMSVTFALSALPDAFIADWLARRTDPARSALRLQRRSGVAAAVSAVALFWSAPAEWHAKIAFVCAASLAFRLSYAIFDVSQNALISLLPRSPRDIRRYVTSKTLASSIGRLLASLLLVWALAAEGDAMVEAKVMALIALPVIATCLSLGRAKVASVPGAALRRDFRWSALPLRDLAGPIAAITWQVGFLGLISRLLPLFGHGERGYGAGAHLVFAMVGGTIVGPILTHARSAHGRLRRLLTIVAVSGGATITGIALVSPHGVYASLALAFLYGVTLSGVTNLIWERAAQIAAWHNQAGLARIDAPVFALLTTAIKLAIAASTVTFGLLFDGFKRGDPAALLAIMVVTGIGGLGTALSLAWPLRTGPATPRPVGPLSLSDAVRAAAVRGSSG